MPSDLQVTNIKANDGTAGLVISDSTGNATFSGDIDVNGNKIILDADADSYFKSNADDQIDIFLANSGTFNFNFKLNTGFTEFGAGVTASYADDATLTVTSTQNCALVYITQETDGFGALFFMAKKGGTVLVADPSGEARNANVDGYINFFKSDGSNSATFKNRMGGTKTFRIGMASYV